MLKFFQKTTPFSFFLFTAILCEILFNYTTPPFQAPDEFNHFYRTYQISEGYFLPHKQDKRLGGEIPFDVLDFAAPFKMESVVPQFKPSRNGNSDSFTNAVSSESQFKDFPNTTCYSPIPYLPQSILFWILKKMDVSVATLYYAGRLLGFIISLLAMAYVIKIIPVYKWLVSFLALLPMNLFIINSFSADNVTNILSFLLIALIFKYTFSKDKITHKKLFYLVVIAALLALSKFVYVSLILLIFIIPGNKFMSRRQQIFSIACIFVISLFLAFSWSSLVMKNYLTYNDYNPAYRVNATLVGLADYYKQKTYIIHNPGYFPKVIWNSIFDPDQIYLASYIGRFGAYLDVPMPLWIIVISYLVVLFIALTEKNELTFSSKQLLILVLAPFSSFVLLVLAQHLAWDPVAYGKTSLLQGRYLIPLFPLALIALGSAFRIVNFRVEIIAVPFILVLNLFAFWILYQRYIYEPYNEVKHFTCDAEQVDGSGNYKTSSSVYLQGCSNQSTVEARNGKFSARVSPTCPFCFTYVFKGFNEGDLIDVSLWKKGDATMAISGGRKVCGTFYNEFDDVHYTDRRGWVNLHGILVITQPCDTIDVGFFVRNKNDQVAYIDDLTFTLKKIHKK